MNQTQDKFALLRAPFSARSIAWRVGAKNEDGTRGSALPYLDSRKIQDRLDEVIGADKWNNAYTEVLANGKLIAVRCSIGIQVAEGSWVYKEDAAQVDAVNDDKDLERAIKGVYSDALKRAAVQWGIGRYLYAYEAPWVELVNGRIGVVPTLPPEFLPEAERTGGTQANKSQARPNQASTDKQADKPADKPANAAPAQAPAPAPVQAPAAAPAADKAAQAPAADPAAERAEEDAARARAKADALADAAANKGTAATPAPAAASAQPAAAAESGAAGGFAWASCSDAERTLARDLIGKMAKLPAAMMANYIGGPKVADKLNEAARQALLATLEEVTKLPEAQRQAAVTAAASAV